MVRYNKELLEECLARDGATLIGEYERYNRDVFIRFKCSCGNEGKRNIYNIHKNKADCNECYIKNIKKGCRKFIYNKDLLSTCIEKDNAILEGYDGKLYAETFISYTCSCGNTECKKTFRRINTNGGAYCKDCSDKNRVEKNKIKSLENYGVTCTLAAEEVKRKAKCTNLERRGVEYPLQSKEVRDKIKHSFKEKYGFENAMQNPEVAERNLKACLKPKEYIIPEGETIIYQGYENHAFDIIFHNWKLNYKDIVVKRTEVPEIWWLDEEFKKRRYFTDIYIPSKNLIIEVKSTWTFKIEKTITLKKLEAAKSLGYDTLLWVFNGKGKLEEEIIV
jgi:hypothetical protein